MNILIVAAHPDDEILGAGGVACWHLAKGDRVSSLILGEGITSRFLKRSEARHHQVRKLQERSKKALHYLGVRRNFYFQLPDNRFDSVDFLDIVKIVESVKKQVRPNIIYTHHPGDLNIDHRLTCHAVVTATRPMPKESVKRILAFEIPSSTEWNFAHPEHAFTPNVYVDISKYLNTKVKAFQRYVSEVQPGTHPRSLKGIQTLAIWRGLQVGVKAAESFQLIRDILPGVE